MLQFYYKFIRFKHIFIVLFMGYTGWVFLFVPQVFFKLLIAMSKLKYFKKQSIG